MLCALSHSVGACVQAVVTVAPSAGKGAHEEVALAISAGERICDIKVAAAQVCLMCLRRLFEGTPPFLRQSGVYALCDTALHARLAVRVLTWHCHHACMPCSSVFTAAGSMLDTGAASTARMR